MASIRRGTIVRDIIDSLKLQVGNVLPDQTSDKLVLTYDFSNVRVCNIVKSAGGTTTGGATIYTTPANEDFYLTSAHLGFMADATNNTTSVSLTIVVDGATVNLLPIRKLTTTADARVASLAFPVPIKCDRNSSIRIAVTTTAGSINYEGGITGYTVSG